MVRSGERSRRLDRVGDLVRGALSEVFVRGLKDPRVAAGLVTVTGVDVSPDLRHADVWVSVIGDDEQRQAAMQGLESAGGYLRRELGQRIQTKYTPALRFRRDVTAEQGAWVERTLSGLDSEREDEP